MNKAYILLGGNIGDVRANFTKVEVFLVSDGIKITNKSSIYVTKAWGKENQPDFLNQVLGIEVDFDANSLLTRLLSIERVIGRIREEGKKWLERVIDIDILFFNDEIINNPPTLIIPHPYIPFRKFTLTPLFELIPNYVHPSSNKTIAELLAECKDDLEVKKIDL
ncbi:MAG: 2-amino-4-hydroxy-6-hydroxymethyldihydropteridine diphosphokinase [Bacteroidota bacterium]